MTERDDSANEAVAADERARPAGHRPPGDGADAGPDAGAAPDPGADADRPVEVGGQKGPEPTRYGDWEGRGRCTDF